MSIAEAMALLAASEATVIALCREGQIRYRTEHRELVLDRSDVARLAAIYNPRPATVRGTWITDQRGAHQ